MPSSKFKLFTIKLLNWEYWPFSVVYFPVFFYFAWLALRARSIFFFTASNPSIDFGGMFGEKKSEIFDILPQEYIPQTKLIQKGDVDDALKKSEKIGFPLIAKPDIGERGTWVSKVKNQDELKTYAEKCPTDFLLQELIDYPIELGVFFVKRPGEKGRVTSIVRKEFLMVKGDGKKSVLELIKEKPRALLTANLESELLSERKNDILEVGEKLLIEPIGNHCRGTKFLNDTPKIDAELNDAFVKLAELIPDFYFGRFDLKCESYEDLKLLRNFKILELNGAGAEPGHIYEPGYSLIKAYKVIFWHLKVLKEISVYNHKNGVPYWPLKDGIKKWKDHNAHNKRLEAQ